MRNLKSMVAFLVVAAMLFASFTTFAYNDVAADADYAAAVEVLSALEILKGDDKGNFNPDNTITRAEAAAVIVRTLGWEEAAKGAAGATQFTDVAADHWGSGYINMAAQAGIIAGHGDGTFGPEDPVTYEQIVKMLVCALGYEPKALTKGAYPTGYLITANEAKLTAGVSGAAGQEAARKVVAQLTFNALDIPLMEQEGWGSDISYVIYNGNRASDYTYKTLLTEKLGIAKVYGTVTDATTGFAKGIVKFTVDSGSKNDKIQLVEPYDVDFADAAVVDAFAGETGAADALNLLAYGYFKAVDSKDADYELVAVSTVGAEETLVLNFADIVSIAGRAITWDNGEDDGVITVEGADYYLNGIKMTSAMPTKAELADDMIGSVTLVLDETNPETAADYLYVTKYVTAVVEEAQVKNNRIKLTQNIVLPGAATTTRYIRLADEDVAALEDVVVSIKDAEGNDVALEDLEENDVLVIKANQNGDATYKQGKNIEIVVSTATVEGKITGKKTVDGVANWKIGDEYYTVANMVGAPVLATQMEGTFYLNAEGEIALSEAAAGSDNYVIIYKTKANDENYTLYTFGKDGLGTYTLDYNTKVTRVGDATYEKDGLATLVANIKTEGSMTTSGSYNKYNWGSALDTDLLYAITATSDGKVTKLEKLVDKANKKVETSLVEFSADSLVLNAETWLTDATVVFDVPATAADESEFSVATVADLEDKATYKYFAITNIDDTTTADFLVLTDGTTGTNVTNPIAVVTAVASELDEEDIQKTSITYLSEGEEVTILGDFDDETLYPVGTVLVIKKTIDGLLASDCKIVGTIADGAYNDSFTVAGDLDAADAVAKRKVFYGTVAALKNDTVTMNVVDTTVTDFSGNTKLFKLDEVDTYVFDDSKKAGSKIAVADAYDLDVNAVYDDDANTYEFHYAVAVLDDDNALLTLIIIAPQEGEEGTASDHAGSFSDAEIVR